MKKRYEVTFAEATLWITGGVARREGRLLSSGSADYVLHLKQDKNGEPIGFALDVEEVIEA